MTTHIEPRITLAAITRSYDEAMAAEGLSPYKRQRVANRVIWGHPDGFQDALRHPSRDETEEPLSKAAMDVVLMAASSPEQVMAAHGFPLDECCMPSHVGTDAVCRHCDAPIERAAAQRGRAGWATKDLNVDGPWYCKASESAPDHRHEPR